MKSYKLIKTYPGSPKLGFILNDSWKCKYGGKDSDYVINGLSFNPDNYPEFWELVVEKEFEIISYIDDKNNICKLKFNEIKWKQEFVLDNLHIFKIHSIKRLSDSEIFIIGDRFTTININIVYTNIKEFYINNSGKLCIRGTNTGQYTLKNSERVKTPLFQSEDGFDIFEGDEYTIVTNDNFEIKTLTASGNNIYNVKKFSTKEKAEEYIIENKPCLSLKDILTTLDLDKIDIQRITKIVKNKLKIK